MRKRKQSLIAGIVLVVLALGIGYAYLTTTLSINGTSKINNAEWNIYWDNVQVTEGSVTATTPAIDTNKTTVTFSVNLSKPGDFYEFTVDAKNDGTIDAMIDTISSKLNNIEIETLPNYLNYSVTYNDGTTIQQQQELNSGAKETYKIRVEYKKDINASDMPTTEQNLSLSFSVTYVQKNDTSTPVPHPTFETDSWPNIINNLKNNNACGNLYNIGDTKEIDLGSFGVHTVRIANCSTPTECSNSDFSQTACGTVLEFTDSITSQYYDSYEEGWADSNIRTYINSTIYNSFPAEVKSSIINTKVVSYVRDQSVDKYYVSNDKIYLLDAVEIVGPIAYSNTLTRQLDYYNIKNVYWDSTQYGGRFNNCNKIEKRDSSGLVEWLVRDFTIYNETNEYTYVGICYQGSPFNMSQTGREGISPLFRLG